MRARTGMWMAAVMAVAVAGAGLIPQDRTLRFRPTANTEYAYNSVSETSMAISGMMEQTNETKVTSTRVLKIKDTVDGWTKFEWHTRNVKSESTGEAMPGMDPDATGKVMEQVVVAGEVNELATVRNVRVVGGDTSDPMTMMAIGGLGQTMVDLGISGTKLPQGPLAVGQTWKSELNIGKVMNEQSGGMVTSDKSLPVEYKVEGFEMIDGVEHAKITSTTVGSVPISSPMAGEGTLESNTVGTILVNMTNGVATKSSIDGTQTIDLGMVVITLKIKSVDELKKN